MQGLVKWAYNNRKQENLYTVVKKVETTLSNSPGEKVQIDIPAELRASEVEVHPQN